MNNVISDLESIRDRLEKSPINDRGFVMKMSQLQNIIDYLKGCNVEELKSSNKDVAWALAEKVRSDLDRQSCPDVYMRIAMESIVRHFPTKAQASGQAPAKRPYNRSGS